LTNWPEGSAKTGLLSYIKWIHEARPKQITPDGDWNIWLILAGRGWGKTRTGAQDVSLYAQNNPEVRCAVVAPTSGDLRRVCFEGPSGLLKVTPEAALWKGLGKAYNGTTQELRFANGSLIQGYAAIEPDRMRGPQYHRAWADELAAWRYPDAWDQLQFGLRLGEHPQTVITTTPRPTPLIRDIMKRKDVHVTRGSTFENTSLAAAALQTYRDRYEGTKLGRQELYGEVLDEIDGALWNHGVIDRDRIKRENLPELRRVVVAIDPAVTMNDESAETGIVVAAKGEDNRYYVMSDESGRFSPEHWARRAVHSYYEYKADRIIGEVNQGGDLIERMLRIIDPQVSYRSVTATRGKLVRAEPIAALYEQGKVSHVGAFPTLEDQMCTYVGGGKSPDRFDALVWALTELSASSGAASWRIS